MKKQGFLDTRALVLAALGGVTSAVLGRLLGRALHVAMPMPMLGSVAAALPRAVVLLLILCRVRRRGILTAAGVAEAVAGLGLGGAFPMSVLSPLAGGIAGDLAWLATRFLPSDRARLVFAGGVLCGARVLAVLAVLALVRVPVSEGGHAGPLVMGGVIADRKSVV